jgi:hypothetical protein
MLRYHLSTVVDYCWYLIISWGGKESSYNFNLTMSWCFIPEMKPQWFPEDGIPYEKMWPDDILWYPLYLKGIKFKGHFLYQGYDTILNYTLTQLDHLQS